MRRAGLLALLAALAGLASGSANAASRVLPGLAFRVLQTPHFRVYYHQGEDALARRVADVAESVRETLPARVGLPAPGVTHVLLLNQDDASNGWATPLPYNTVMLTAAWPAPSEIVGYTNDWLRLVFTHEFTHVLQLHQSRGWARAVRFVFGRAPLAFPNLFLPEWSVEGLATFEETRTTGQGRLAGGDSLALVAQRIREAGVEPVDKVNGGGVEWPGGEGPYLYGGFFAEYLARRFGEQKLGEVSMRTAGRVPYFAAPAYRAVFGETLGELWKDYQRDMLRPATAAAPGSAVGPTAVPGGVVASPAAPSAAAGPAAVPGGVVASPAAPSAAAGPAAMPAGVRQLTHRGYYVLTPRFTADGGIVYATRDADDFPAIRLLSGVGQASGLSVGRASGLPVGQASGLSPTSSSDRKVTTRYGGEQLSVSHRTVFYDQADYAVNVAWRSDLFAADLATRRVQRLTRGARLLAPDVSPDGRSLACVRIGARGERELAVFRIDGAGVGGLRLSEQALPRAFAAGGASYGSPRWAPGSGRLAVERVVPGGASEIVVLDLQAGEAQVAASSAAGRNITPAWTPDGHSIVFASDRDGGPFQLYAVRLDTGATRKLLAVPGGAMSPELAADGSRLLFIGYTAAGYDLFEAPLLASGADGEARRSGVEDSGVPPRFAVADTEGAQRVEVGATRTTEHAYNPLLTLLPRSWYPAGDTANGNLRLGFSTGGMDVLGRHSFGLTTLWRVRGGEDALDGPHRGRPDWSAFYAYDRWRPTLFASASDETSFVGQYAGTRRLPDAELRERNYSVGVSLPFLFLRHGQLWQTAFNVEHDTLDTVRGLRAYNRNAMQTAWAFNSAHVFGFSISQEHGVAIGVTSEQVRSAFGADGNADAFTGEARGYLRLGGRHSVLAARAALGVGNGDANVARVFYLGGSQPASSLIDFGSGAFSMLRGFGNEEFAATHVGVANLEYRFPLLRFERGRGTWPLFLRTLHAAVFADAGQVWDHHVSWSGAKASFGAEVSLDTVLGFGLPLTVSTGIARPWDGQAFRSPAAYVRVGRAF